MQAGLEDRRPGAPLPGTAHPISQGPQGPRSLHVCRPGCTPSGPRELSGTGSGARGAWGPLRRVWMTLSGSALGRVLYGEPEGAAPEPCRGARGACAAHGVGVGWRGARSAACDCGRPGPAGRAAWCLESGLEGLRLPLARAVAGAHASLPRLAFFALG